MTGTTLGTDTPTGPDGVRRQQGSPATSREIRCGQCGHPGEPDHLYCQPCGSLLPDPDRSRVLTSSLGTEEKGVRRHWLRATIVTILLLSILATVGLSIHRGTRPEPAEQLAEKSSHRALAMLTSLSEARTLGRVREISVTARSALTPVAKILPELSSNNDTRPRLDAYRALFRAVASLAHLHRSRLQEWGTTRQRIQSSLATLAADEPMTGALTSQGGIAIDATQDQIDEIERSRSVNR